MASIKTGWSGLKKKYGKNISKHMSEIGKLGNKIRWAKKKAPVKKQK